MTWAVIVTRGRIGAKMRRHWHPWAPLTRPPRVQQEHHSHAMASARARKLSAPATLTRHGAPATPMPGMPASQPQTCHDSPWPCPRPCHDTVPQQVLGHQPSQASIAGQQTKECHYTRWPPPVAEHHHPLPVLGGERKRKGHRVEGAPPPMEVQAAAPPPWTVADDGKIHEVS
ncbi:hypothetical protein CJ030_MR8G022758 [Morella rubra]|uniref:Uncharacterized protein n=1 Tax=Morella rubra TaxID=262757 RepID=A0A6A1UQW3_9ROSI|nr:hypothetical protein CJ030_MR8G022758 [Morella rubra]